MFAACKANIPGAKSLQIANIMWSVMPEEQAAIWISELRKYMWTACEHPEAVLQTVIEQLVSADPAGSETFCNYLDFKPTRNETYIATWY